MQASSQSEFVVSVRAASCAWRNRLLRRWLSVRQDGDLRRGERQLRSGWVLVLIESQQRLFEKYCI